MLSPKELLILKSRLICHEARSLYVFCLRTRASADWTVAADYGVLKDEMSVFAPDSCKSKRSYVPDADEITRLIDELAASGIIRAAKCSGHYHGCKIFLNVAAEDAAKHASSGAGEIYCMHEGWRPSAGFADTARLAQLIRPDYLLADVEDFQGYWLARRHAPASGSAWDRKFAQYLKRKISNNSKICLIAAKKDGE